MNKTFFTSDITSPYNDNTITTTLRLIHRETTTKYLIIHKSFLRSRIIVSYPCLIPMDSYNFIGLYLTTVLLIEIYSYDIFTGMYDNLLNSLRFFKQGWLARRINRSKIFIFHSVNFFFIYRCSVHLTEGLFTLLPLHRNCLLFLFSCLHCAAVHERVLLYCIIT